jgi:hypothetical protein
VGEKRLPCVDRIAARRCARRQPLVCRDVLDESEQLGCEGRLPERDRAVNLDARRQLHDVIVGKTLDRALVSDVHNVHLA